MKSTILLITPPFTQLNTPYPATAYLKGFLNTKNISSFQCDLGIEVILEVFSKKGLTKVFEKNSKKPSFDILSFCTNLLINEVCDSLRAATHYKTAEYLTRGVQRNES